MIEKYIQFAIDNGYKKYKHIPVVSWKYWDAEDSMTGYSIVEFETRTDTGLQDFEIVFSSEIITSKEFIEAIARGIESKYKYITDAPDDYINIIDKYGDVAIRLWKMGNGIIDDICKEQAIAIRDNKLEEFINNILPNEQKPKHNTK